MEISIIAAIISLSISIVILVRWWRMTKDIQDIKNTIAKVTPKNKVPILYLLGKHDAAREIAIENLVIKLLEMRGGYTEVKIDETINNYRKYLKQFDITLPEELSSAAKFIEFSNKTGMFVD